MAYGNWGAFVYRNGERVPTHEDAIPYKEEDGASGFPFVLLTRAEGEMPCHATLGQGRMRVCGYKASMLLYFDGQFMDEQQVRKDYCTPIEVDDDGYLWEGDGAEYRGEIEGYRFHARPFGGNMIDLELVEPDGTLWTSRCGYAFGAGFDAQTVDEWGQKPYSSRPWT